MDEHREAENKAIKGTVLIMDDDEDVCLLVDYALRYAGFRVESAPDGPAAIDLYRNRLEMGQPYIAVILDLNIPGKIGGKEVVVNLRELNPKIIAFVSSGYPDDPCMVNFKDYGFSGAIPKPIMYEEILESFMHVIEKIGNK